MAAKRRFLFKIKLSEYMLLVLVIVSGAFLAFSSGGFVVSLKTIGFSVFSSVESQLHSITKGVSDTFGSVRELSRLKKDYNDLTQKLETYEQMRRSNAEIRKENDRLRAQLKFSNSIEEKNYPAEVVARDGDNLYSFLTINKGSAAGIRKNMPVIAYQDGTPALVGKITQVGRFTSIVMPVYNLNCTVSGRIQATRDLGLISGNGKSDAPLSMKYIRKRVLDELHFGDIVVTSGENNNYMKDLPIGSISKITVLDYNSSLDIEITPIIDFSRLEYVVVVNMHEVNDSKEE